MINASDESLSILKEAAVAYLNELINFNSCFNFKLIKCIGVFG